MRTLLTVAVLFAFVTIAAGAILAEMLFGAAQIVIVNDSRHTLRDVSVSGRGIEFRFAELRPGTSSCHTARGFGEASLRMQADLDDHRIESGELGYLEGRGGYRVLLRVSDSGEIDFEYVHEMLHRLSCSPKA